jgi:peptide/nickel transport system permease protein
MSNVGSYLLRRLIQLPLVVLLVTILIFMLMHVTPGDPISLMLGQFATPDAVASLRESYGLDKSLPEQYLLWLQRMVRGDLGESIRQHHAVTAMIRERFPISFTLALAAISFSLLIAIPAGLLSAVRRNTWVDYLSTTLAIGGLSIPNFALALVLIYVFAVKLDLVPISGIGTTSASRSDSLWGLVAPYILPTVALGVQHSAVLARQLRASMLEVLNQDYVRTARAKGLTNSSVVVRHAMRNAMIPIMTLLAIQFAYLVGTTITIEFVFGIPGMGSALLDAVVSRDFPVIQGFTFFMAVFFVFINILADVSYSVLDPRIRYG